MSRTFAFASPLVKKETAAMSQNQPPETRSGGQTSQTSSFVKMALLFLITIGATFFITRFFFGNGSLLPAGDTLSSNSLSSLAQPGLIEIEVDGVNLGTIHRLDPPQSVEIDGFQFAVSGQYLNDNVLWQSMEMPANQVGWLENSIINYIFRVPGSRSYREVLENAASTNSVVHLTTTQGNQLAFQLTDLTAQPLAATDPALQQTRPAITLLWLGEAGNEGSFLVSGNYIAAPPAAPALAVESSDSLPSDVGNQLAVHLQTADLQTNGLQLVLQGTITNRSAETQLVEAQELTLATNGLVSQILAVDPPLPWQVPPNNSQIFFTITFQRPPDANAHLVIGPQHYALTFAE